MVPKPFTDPDINFVIDRKWKHDKACPTSRPCRLFSLAWVLTGWSISSVSLTEETMTFRAGDQSWLINIVVCGKDVTRQNNIRGLPLMRKSHKICNFVDVKRGEPCFGWATVIWKLTLLLLFCHPLFVYTLTQGRDFVLCWLGQPIRFTHVLTFEHCWKLKFLTMIALSA